VEDPVADARLLARRPERLVHRDDRLALAGEHPLLAVLLDRLLPLLEQGNPVPVFLKRAINEWEYVGHWRATKLDKDQEAIARHSPNAARVSGVLFMEPSEP